MTLSMKVPSIGMSNGWGGHREGAGRKAPNGAKVTATFRISRESKARLSELREQGVNTSALIDNFIKNIEL